MDENELLENQALEGEEALEDGGQGEAVDAQNEHDEAGDGGAGVSAENSDDAGRSAGGRQSHEDNAAARAARIRAEQETTQRLQNQYDEQIAGLGVPNPYTGRPFGSFKEFREYGEQFRRENLEQEAKKQGKPVEELVEERENRAYIARKRKEEQDRQTALDALERRRGFLTADLQTFVDKYPDVDVAKLEQNPKFCKFAGKRLYREPLSELYGDFVELVSDAERAAVEKAAGKQGRGTGSGQGGGGVTLSPAQSAELAEWNRDNPGMKMTAKEFSGR